MKMITALLVVSSLALAACGSSSNSSSSGTGSGGATASGGGGAYGYGSGSSKKTTASNSSGSSSTEVEMDDDYFKPKTITGKAGSTVKIELKNEGSNEHNFTIDSQKKTADADVEPGKTATVSVKIPASGSVQFYCEYHKGLGMVGTVKAA
jgi:plastocyanin